MALEHQKVDTEVSKPYQPARFDFEPALHRLELGRTSAQL